MRVDTSNEAAGPLQKVCCQPGTSAMDLAPGARALPAEQAADSSRRWNLALILGFGLIAIVYLLLWSPWWYPLSDSSLFISVARNMDEARGYTYMGRPHRMLTPLAPAMLWGLMKVSRSFGLMNASMVACMLGSFPFMYLVLKEHLDRGKALALTMVSALTYWQFHLASIVMSDQAFALLFWMALYFLVLARRRPDHRILWLALASASLLVGIGFRIAGMLVVPVVAVGLWVEYMGEMPIWRRTVLAGAVILPLLIAGAGYWRWQGEKFTWQTRPREYLQVPKPAPIVTSQAATAPVSEIIGYVPQVRILVTGIQRAPGVFGRWLAESLAEPSRELFVRQGWRWEAIVGAVIAAIALVGVWRQVRARKWWLVLPILYVLAVVVMWGTRYIPRYMVPVTPMLVLWLSSGTGAILAKTASWLRVGGLAGGLRRVGTIGVPVIVLLCNVPILAAEIYVCHSRDFYGTVRQGAVAELVDASAYVRKTLPKDVLICMNDYIRRREVHLLTGRAVAVYDGVNVAGPADDKNIRRFFALTGARCAIIRYAGAKYPEWHFDLTGRTPKDRAWWGLYVWDEQQKQPVRIVVPREREWFLELPDSVM